MQVLSRQLSLKRVRSVWNCSSEWEAIQKSPECHIFNTDPKIFLTEYKEKSLCPEIYLSNRQVVPEYRLSYCKFILVQLVNIRIL